MGYSQTAATPGALPVRRPTLITAIGVISIVFCSGTLFFSLISYVMMFIFGGPAQMMRGFSALYQNEASGLYDAMMNITLKYYALTTIQGIIQTVLQIIGLAGGIMVFKPNPRGALLLKTFAIGSFASLAAEIVFMVPYYADINGAMKDYFATLGDDRFVSMTTGITNFAVYFGLIIGIIFMAAWPVLLLVLINQKKSKEYFSAGQTV